MTVDFTLADKLLDAAEQQGRMAAYMGEPRKENVFPNNSVLQDAWLRGYDDLAQELVDYERYAEELNRKFG